MPTTEVNLPSGRVMKVQHPEGARTEDILAYAKSEYDATLDKGNLLVEAGKTFFSGAVQSAINAGAGITQTYGMMLGPEADESDEAVDAFIASRPSRSRYTRTRVKAHRKAKNEAIATVNENAHRMRELANSIDERMGIDPEFAASLPGQIVNGLGQVPMTIAAAAAGTAVAGPAGTVGAVVAVSAPQMMTEAINDAERTLQKDYSEMDQEEKNQVALSSAGYMALGTALEVAGFKVATQGLSRFLRGQGKLTSGQLKSLKREVAEGFAAEGFTESAQGQLLDSFAKATYDDDRELMSMEVLGRRFNEFIVGGVVGGVTTGGVGTFERAATGRLFQPKEDKVDEEAPPPPPADVGERGDIPLRQKTFNVTYTDSISGQELTQSVEALDADQASARFNDALGDAYDTDIGITIEEVGAPTEPVDTEEEVDLRYGVGTRIEGRVEELRVAARQEMANDPSPESVTDADQSEARLPQIINSVISKAKGILRDKGLPVTAANIERAIDANPNFLTSEIKAPKDRALARKRLSLASELEAQGKNAEAEIDREDFFDVYDQDTVEAIGILQDLQFEQQQKDVTAEAMATYIPQRFVGERAEAAPPFFKKFQPEQYDEGRFVDLETTEDLSDQTFEGGSIRIQDGRPVLETSDTSTESIMERKPSEEGALVRSNLFKQKAGWKWTQAPEGEPSTIVSVEQGSKHYYTLDFTSGKPLTLKTYPEKKSEPRGRPTTRGEVKLGNKVGEIEVRGKKHPVYDRVTVGEPDVVAEAAPFTAPKKSRISHVKQSDIIDIDALIEEIVEEGAPVWFWGADQLGEGTIQLPNQKGMKIKLDAGPSYALKPANRAAGRVWASSMSVTGINNRINDLKYTDKDGNEKTGYIFLVSGSPNRMHLFNKQAFRAFYENAFAGMSFKKVKSELLAAKPTKPVRDILNKHNSLESLIDSADSKPFIEALVDQRSKTKSKMFQYLDSKGFYTLEHARLLDGFYRKHNFQQNDIMLVVQPTKATDDDPKHGTYKNSVYGKVIGVPDKRLDAYLLMPERIMKGRPVTLEPNQAAQVVAPYGSRVTEIQKVVGSQQAQRAVKKLLRIIKENPDGFTVDTAGEFADGGFIVAPDKETELLLSRETLDEESLTRYIIEHADKLSVDGAMLGGWFNTESGEYVLDVVFSVDNLGDAVDIAIWGDQDAIFDLDTFTEIRTKDDNKNPTTPPDDSRTASEILNQRPSESLGEYASQRRREPRGVRPAVPRKPSEQAAVVAEAGTSRFLGQDLTSPEGGFNSIKAMEDFIRDNFGPIAKKLGIQIEPTIAIGGQAQYNVSQGSIQYHPGRLFEARSQEGIRAAMREEIIHAAMHKVLMKRSPSKSRNDAWLDFMSGLGQDLTQEQRDAIAGVYSNLTRDDQFGAEYSRAAIQYLLYGDATEQYVVGGKAWDKIKSLFKSVQTYLARMLGKDIDQNPEAAAVIRDSVALVEKSDPKAKITNQRISKKAEKIADRNDGTGDVDTEVIVNAAQPPSKKKDLNAFDKYIFTATSVMNRISPELSRLFKQFFFRVDKQTLDHMKRVQPFVKKYNAIKNKKDKLRLKQLLYYSPDIDPRAEERQQRVAERTALLRKYDMLNDYNLRVRPTLDVIRVRANQEGMEVPYLNDYFPRKVVDLDKIREYYGEVVVKDFSSYIERINEQRAKEVDPSKRKPPIERGSNEEALEFDKYIRSGEFTKRGIKPRNTQQRTIEFVDEEIADAYADPGEALESYINSMVMATETMRLLGRRYEVEGENVKFEKGSELSQTIQRLLAEGKINDEQAFRTIPQFARIILNPVMKEVGLLSGVRSFSYFTLLVEPTTTLSHLFDLPFQMYDNGFFPVLSAALGKKTFRLSDAGIDNQQVSAEFKNERKWLDDAVRLGLRATGFSRLDQLMKETGMQANYNRYRKLARGYKKNRDSNQSKKFKTELEFIMGNDADAAIAALNKGDQNNDLVRELIRSKLLETQPISRMEMPLIVSQNPNTRALYTMKSFMVTQLNVVVNKMLSQIFGRNKTKQQRLKGASDLAKLMFFMVMIGMPADALKDLLAGRLGYLSDYLFNGIFRVAGISRYQTYVARKEGIGQAAFDYVTPVGIQQAVDITAELQRVATGQKAITDSKLVTLAPFSDVINRVFGFSREREAREYERRAREGDLPTFIPPGAL